MSGNTMTGIAGTGAGTANPLAAGTQLNNTGKISGKISVPPGYANKTEVRAYIPGTSFSDNSDENGNFTITGVPVGTYTLNCEAPGLMPFQIMGVGVDMQNTTAMGPLMIQMMGSQGSAGMTQMMGSQGSGWMQGMMGY